MLRRLSFLVPPILFVVFVLLVASAIWVGFWIPAPLAVFVCHVPADGRSCRHVLMITDGSRTLPLITLENNDYRLFTSPGNRVYLHQKHWLYQINDELEPIQVLNDEIRDRVTWTVDGFIYGDGQNLVALSLETHSWERLTQSHRQQHSPALSSTGDTLAYVDGANPLYSSVVLMSLSTGEQRTIGQGTRPVWSPDGTHLLYIDGDNVYHMYHLLSDLDTVMPIEYLPHFIGFGVQWMADGKHLLYTDLEGSTFLLRTIHIETLETMTWTVIDTDNQTPRLSPDGQRVAYTSFVEGKPFLFLLDFTTRTTINTGVTLKWQTGQLVWSPDGRYIMLVVPQGKRSQVVRYDVQNQRMLYGVSTELSFGRFLWQYETSPFEGVR